MEHMEQLNIINGLARNIYGTFYVFLEQSIVHILPQ